MIRPGVDEGAKRIEAFALALLAVVPLLPYVLTLARGTERFSVTGDYAALETATRLAFTGKTLLGPYSRFGFNHPGPLYFFILAPIYALSGRTTAAMYAGACAINALAAFAVVFSVRAAATRAHAIAALLVVLGWLAAFGNACAVPWNPVVVVLPLLAFLVLAALVAEGRTRAAPFAAFFGALAAETHLSTVPSVIGVSLAALTAALLGARRRGGLFAAELRPLMTALGIVLLALAPPVVEEVSTQLAGDAGNLTKAAHFFLTESAPKKPLASTLGYWARATAWLPERVLDGTLARDGYTFMSSEVASPAPRSTIVVSCAFAALVATSLVTAVKRRDRTSAALLATGALASALAVLALRRVVGETLYYLLFWTTASTAVGWIGVASTLANAVTARRSREGYVFTRMALVGGVLAVVPATTLQRAWLARGELLPQPDPALRDAYGSFVTRLRRTGETPIIHPDSAWQVGLALLNELTKDGIEARVDRRERWILGSYFAPPAGVRRPLHVYTRTPSQPLAIAACLEPAAKSGDIEILVGPREVSACPADTGPEIDSQRQAALPAAR